MEGCPCCTTETNKYQLTTKPLLQLSAGDLEHYLFKAMTTWGEVNDFKHFLPRIFDLLASDTQTLEVFVVFDKLEYGQWKQWSIKEQESIKLFLISWWANSTLSEQKFQGDNFLYFIRALDQVQPLLDNWSIDIEKDTFKNLIHFIFDNLQQYKIGKDIDITTERVTNDWLLDYLETIEKGFFYYEKLDTDFAQTISYCYDIVHRLTLT